MGEESLCIILIGMCGRETQRIALVDGPAREILPLRDLVRHGLAYEAAGLIVIRRANRRDCSPCALDFRAVETAHRTLHPIGLRLHDYILWYGERCVSLRLTGRL